MTPATIPHSRQSPSRREAAANVSKGVAVEEEERGATVALPQEIDGLGEGQWGGLEAGPVGRERCVSFRIKAVLRASSCARSTVEAGDKLPVPVCEKSGSGL